MQRKKEQEIKKTTYVVKSSPMTLTLHRRKKCFWFGITEDIYFPLNGETDGMNTF